VGAPPGVSDLLSGLYRILIRCWRVWAGFCLNANLPERRTGPPVACEALQLHLSHGLQPVLRSRLISDPKPLRALDRVKAVDADEGSGDFADAGGEGTVADADDVACHEDRVVVAGAGGVGVKAEDAPIHLPLADETDEFGFAFEQACAACEVDG